MISFDLSGFSSFKSVLCLNGELPSKRLLLSFDLPIIAADGAYNKLSNMGINPVITIGDLDSISPKLLDQIPHVRNTDQDYSDFQKALQYIIANDLYPSIICGISGGYFDHILNNLSIFLQFKDNIFLDDKIVGFLSNQQTSLQLPINTKISIFGIPSCEISTTGLKWELKNELLKFPGKNSSLNRVKTQKVFLDISKGSALIIIYKHTVKDAGLNSLSL